MPSLSHSSRALAVSDVSMRHGNNDLGTNRALHRYTTISPRTNYITYFPFLSCLFETDENFGGQGILRLEAMLPFANGIRYALFLTGPKLSFEED